MSNILLVEMEFNNKVWYLSTEGYTGKNYYAPYLTKNPSLEFGQVKGGYVGVRFGNLEIVNAPNDKLTPFSIYSGGYSKLLTSPTQSMPVQVYWEQEELTDSLFDGKMYMKQFGTNSFKFLLEDKFKDLDLLEEVVEYESDLTTLATVSITASGTTATVQAPDHKLSTGDLITVTGSSTANFNVSDSAITVVDDNSFTYTVSSTTATETSGYTLKHYQKKNAPFSFGDIKKKKGLIKTSEVDGDEFANPQLDITTSSPANPLLLFDDGVLVGTSDDSLQSTTTRTIDQVTKNGDEITVRVTSAHGATGGEVCKITDLAHSDYNGTFVIKTAPSTTTLTLYNNTTESITDQAGTLNIAGNFFGDIRVPTTANIKSRQVDPTNETAYNASSNPGSGGTRLIGTALVSGMSTNGETVADFFAYISEKLLGAGGFSLDFTKAPNASTDKLQLWVTAQTKIVDFAGKIAEGSNYLFSIDNDKVTVIDRANIPDTFTKIANKDVVKASYKIPFPTKGYRARWKINTANTTVSPAKLDMLDQSILISNTDSGKVVDVMSVTDNIDDVRTYITAIKNILTKNLITVVAGGVRTDIKIGDRIKFDRAEEGLSADFIVRTLSYNINGLETTYSGDGTITVIEQTDVY